MKKIKNNTGSDQTWIGQKIVSATYYELQIHEEMTWAYDSDVQSDIDAGNLIVNDGTSDITDTIEAKAFLKLVQNGDATRILNTKVDDANNADKKGLTYNSTSGNLEYNLSRTMFELSFANEAQFYLIAEETTYEILVNYLFRGTDVIGSPDAIKMIATTTGSIGGLDVRIYDVTNSLVICEKLGFLAAVDQVFEIVDLGTLSNLPTSSAIFELQVKLQIDGAGKRGWISALSMEWAT